MYKHRNAKVFRPAKEGRPQDDKKREGTDIVTTATAGNLAGHTEKDKEKVEKRRALGRGLESLLPGPRVVRPPQANSVQDVAPASGVSRVSTGAEAPGSGGADAALKGRSSTSATTAPSPAATTSASPEATAVEPNAAGQAPGTAELRSAGQPKAAVPTNPTGMAAVPAKPTGLAGVYGATALAESAIATGAVDYDPFGDAPTDGVIEIQAVADTRMPSNLVVNVAIADVDKNPFQTRAVEDDDALDELSDSIKANGVVQPIVVRPAKEDGRYILVIGERRLHASKKAGKTHIPALVRRISEQQAAEMTIIENLQREDLSPLEQAQAFKVLSTQFNLTQEEIGKRVGLSRVSIANYMRLLKLPREVMELLAQKSLTFGEAKELLSLENADQIAHAAIYAVKKGMTAEQIERMVLSMNGLEKPFPGMPGQEKKSSGARWVDPNVRSAQVDLERLLGVRVRIRDRKGKGKIVIEYSTVDDYERVVEMLRGKK
ncbi:MAG TPA: ParB/RepB/Spo0J family partition protein [Candidatus Sulfotelmatobacter sp.]|nr:ParB/RepB/Spo0J family partition protein [Candidatus Sulfotelmatobacter sp.]